MAYRPAQVYTGSGWDDIGDKRMLTHDHSGGANGANIAQSSVTNLTTDLASKVDYALPVNAQTGTTYTFVAADAEKLTTASNAAAVTLTIPPQSSVTWADNTVLRVVNYGAGAVTVAGGSGVTVTNTATTLAQFESAAAIRTGSDAWTLVPFGSSVKGPSSVEYLVVAGGGGGGQTSGTGGGGAGGYRCSVSGETSGGGAAAESALSITAGTSYTVTVGAGGAGGGTVGGTGSNSVFGGVTSLGGGGGGSLNVNGVNGGSGGGQGSRLSAGGSAGSGTANQGNNGGLGSVDAGGQNANLWGGGGGGAGAVGGNATTSAAGSGGAGVSSSITGSAFTRGVGGAGGGGSSSGNGATAAANSGNGGGGGNFTSVGGAGGSGVVIIRQARSDSNVLAQVTGSPTVTVTATHFVYVFNSSGTIEWAA